LGLLISLAVVIVWIDEEASALRKIGFNDVHALELKDVCRVELALTVTPTSMTKITILECILQESPFEVVNLI
jgi:hypothetical protein